MSITDRIYTRQKWDARPPRDPWTTQAPSIEAFVHHSGPENGRSYDHMREQTALVRSFQNYHMDTHGWDDIGYHWVVFQWVGKSPMARAFAGRPSWAVPAAQLNHNTRTLAICVVGNGNQEPMQPNTRFMIERLIGMHRSIVRVGGHRDVVQTDCPGDKFYSALSIIASRAKLARV